MSPFEVIDVGIVASGAGVSVSLASVNGAIHGVLRSPDLDELESLRASVQNQVRFAIPGSEKAADLGARLGDIVFGVPRLRSLFQRTRGAAAAGKRPLLVRLMVASSELATLPWELIADPDGGSHRYLTLARDAHVVRLARERTYTHGRAATKPPLRMLLILSSPPVSADGQNWNFDIYEEKAVILRELRDLEDRGLIEIDIVDRPTVNRIRERIAKRRMGYDVVHYLGHALPTGLILEDERGLSAEIGGDQFTLLLNECPSLGLVVFGGCETAQPPNPASVDDWDARLSIADRCVRNASPIVIGMQNILPFQTERVFCRVLYQSLAAGRSLAEAVALGRAAVRDDTEVGNERLDWMIPSVFVGGDPPGSIIDPTVEVPHPPRRPRRVQLRLDAFEGNREDFARLLPLRQAIDFLRGPSQHRLLTVTSGTHRDRHLFVDRALDDLGNDIQCVLQVDVTTLLGNTDPLGELCDRVCEVVRRCDVHVDGQAALPGTERWPRILETIREVHMAIVLGQAERLAEPGAGPAAITEAVRVLVRQRSRARLVLFGEVFDSAAILGEEGVSTLNIPLEQISWDEIWRWIRRNHLVLARFGETTLRQVAYVPLGSELADWRKLAELVYRSSLGLHELVKQVVAARPQRRQRVERIDDRGQDALGVRIAIAGPHVLGRAEQFATLITEFARMHAVGGQVSLSVRDGARALATLVSISSPLAGGGASNVEILAWLDDAARARPHIILLDHDIPQPDGAINAKIVKISERTLILGTGSDDGRPSYPGWYPEVLAIGPIAEPKAPWDPALRKPDLFAPTTVKDLRLAEVVKIPELRRTSLAALHVLAASILIQATDNTLGPAEIRQTLIATAQRDTDGRSQLDLRAGLQQTRMRKIERHLDRETRFADLVATTSIPATTALNLLELLVRRGRVEERTSDRGPVYVKRATVPPAIPVAPPPEVMLEPLRQRAEIYSETSFSLFESWLESDR